jgi:FKBP-type peptidyl-prolyl cis-trans isomerase 2
MTNILLSFIILSKIISFMKKVFFVCVSILALALFFGCTAIDANDTTGGDNLDTNTNTNGDNNSSQYNNLDQFKKVKNGDFVSVHYIGKLQDGSIFDTSVGRDPLSFVVGAGQMIKGFDAGVVGMKSGETKTITLPPEQAYGTKEQGQKGYVDANFFPSFADVNVGSQFELADGRLAEVLEKNDTNALVLAYHRLAGKTLIFEIQLVSIE